MRILFNNIIEAHNPDHEGEGSYRVKGFSETVSLDEIGMKDRIRAEIQAHNEFQESVLGREVKEKIKIKDVDIRNYAKHILRKRPMHEKRELLKHLKSKMVLKEKQLSLID